MDENKVKFETLNDNNGLKWGYENYDFSNSSSFFNDGYYNIGINDGVYYDRLSNSIKAELDSYRFVYYDGVRYDKRWTGSCFGQAITTILFKNNVLDVSDYQSSGNVNKQFDLVDVRYNKNLKYMINIYQSLYIPLSASNGMEKLNSIDSLEDVYKSVNKFYDSSSDDFLEMNFYWDDKGHAINIVGAPEDSGYNNGFLNKYRYRIPIYDNAYLELRYLYISNGFTNYSFGNEEETIACGYGSIIKCDVYKVDKNHIMNIENDKVEIDATCSIIDEDKEVTFSNSKGEYAKIKNGEKVDGTLNCNISKEVNEEESENKVSNLIGVAFDEEDIYTVEQENSEELKADMYFKDSYLTARTTSRGKAVFENKKSVKLENPTGREFETSLTVNDEYLTMPWYTITLTGDGAKEIEIKMTDEGIMVLGDNLKNVKVQAKNSQESVDLDLNTNENKVLLKASKDNKELVISKNESISNVKDANLDIYVDKDKDGVYETKIQTATSNSVKTGDKILIFVSVFIISNIILVIIISKKRRI